MADRKQIKQLRNTSIDNSIFMISWDICTCYILNARLILRISISHSHRRHWLNSFKEQRFLAVLIYFLQQQVSCSSHKNLRRKEAEAFVGFHFLMSWSSNYLTVKTCGASYWSRFPQSDHTNRLITYGSVRANTCGSLLDSILLFRPQEEENPMSPWIVKVNGTPLKASKSMLEHHKR